MAQNIIGSLLEPHSDWIALLLAAGVALALLWSRWRPLPFTRRSSLLSDGERRFYRVLLAVTPLGVTVFAKVRLLDVVSVPDHAWRTHGSRGSGMHLDFLLADALTCAPLLAIELDDVSHARPAARRRDAFKDAAFAAAGLPLLRIAAAGRYAPDELRARIEAAACVS